MLTLSKNKIPVYDRHNSHISCELDALREAIENTHLEGGFIKHTYTFTNRWGFTICVATNENDKIYYKQRPGRRGLTRFVASRQPERTNELTFVAMRKVDIYVILTAFWGSTPEPETWDEDAFMRDSRGYEEAKRASEQFWATHALIETHIR